MEKCVHSACMVHHLMPFPIFAADQKEWHQNSSSTCVAPGACDMLKTNSPTWTSIHPSTCWTPPSSANPPSMPLLRSDASKSMPVGSWQAAAPWQRRSFHHLWSYSSQLFLSAGQQQMQGQTSEVWVEHEAISDRNGRNGQLIRANLTFWALNWNINPWMNKTLSLSA